MADMLHPTDRPIYQRRLRCPHCGCIREWSNYEGSSIFGKRLRCHDCQKTFIAAMEHRTDLVEYYTSDISSRVREFPEVK